MGDDANPKTDKRVETAIDVMAALEMERLKSSDSEADRLQGEAMENMMKML